MVYPDTPRLSVEAVQERETVLEVVEETVRPVGIDGGVVSAVDPPPPPPPPPPEEMVELWVVAEILVDGADLFPEASKASTVYL
jgi:hypothetical protein